MKSALLLCALLLLLLLAGCGGPDDENCKEVRYVPEVGDPYNRIVCEGDPLYRP